MRELRVKVKLLTLSLLEEFAFLICTNSLFLLVVASLLCMEVAPVSRVVLVFLEINVLSTWCSILV